MSCFLTFIHTPDVPRLCYLRSQEIYANSVFPGGGTSDATSPSPAFQSIVEVVAEGERSAGSGAHDRPLEAAATGVAGAVSRRRACFMGDRVHVVWGLSKDFGMSGYRVGAVYTHNTELFSAVRGRRVGAACRHLQSPYAPSLSPHTDTPLPSLSFCSTAMQCRLLLRCIQRHPRSHRWPARGHPLGRALP